jgi:hypothetical protein
MSSEEGNPFLVLMHGDCGVSTRQLARALGKNNPFFRDFHRLRLELTLPKKAEAMRTASRVAGTE